MSPELFTAIYEKIDEAAKKYFHEHLEYTGKMNRDYRGWSPAGKSISISFHEYHCGSCYHDGSTEYEYALLSDLGIDIESIKV